MSEGAMTKAHACAEQKLKVLRAAVDRLTPIENVESQLIYDMQMFKIERNKRVQHIFLPTHKYRQLIKFFNENQLLKYYNAEPLDEEGFSRERRFNGALLHHVPSLDDTVLA